MVAKGIITAFAVFCFFDFTAGSVASTKLCQSQTDCKPSECCSKRFMHDENYCVPRRKLNEICIADELGSSLINGVYDITCPCEGDLKCIKEKYIGRNGIMITKGLPRCREPTYAGSPPFNYYNSYDNEAFASANSYGNNNNYNNYGKGPSASANSYGNSNNYNTYGKEPSASANSYGNSNKYNTYGKEPSASANSYGNSNSNSYASSQS